MANITNFNVIIFTHFESPK